MNWVEVTRWSVDAFRSIKWMWSESFFYPLNRLLNRQNNEVVDRSEMSAIPIIKKISFAGVISLMTKSERSGYRGKLFWAEPGQLIYSKIRAKQGSLALVPRELGRIAVSAEYPVYKLDTNNVIPDYLTLLLKCSSFLHFLEGIASGGATKTRTSPEQFEALRIAIPMLPVQKAIVSYWKTAQEKVKQAHAKILHLEAEAKVGFLRSLSIATQIDVFQKKCFSLDWKSMDRWSLDYLKRAIASPADNSIKMPWQSLPLGELTDGKNGSTPSTRNEAFWGGDISWISPKDMKAFRLDGSEDTITEEAIKQSTAPFIKGPSVLMVVRSGILQHSVPVALVERDTSINQDIRAFTIKPSVALLPEFLAMFLQCSTERLLNLVKSGVTVQSINTAELETFPIPLPPLEIQSAVITAMNTARETIDATRADAEKLASDTAHEVEEMILGRKPVQ